MVMINEFCHLKVTVFQKCQNEHKDTAVSTSDDQIHAGAKIQVRFKLSHDKYTSCATMQLGKSKILAASPICKRLQTMKPCHNIVHDFLGWKKLYFQRA
ncbi:hypothetical protein VNO77_17571 [Canavalia gladiata]|uniref:Uncharacterized protein n=1 Tax=Canavalia gladiata TaxID=3824 RepID=A0AAN9LMM6_CANGL